MNQFKVNSYKKEFGFLSSIIDGQAAITKILCQCGAQEVFEGDIPWDAKCPGCGKSLGMEKNRVRTRDFIKSRDPKNCDNISIKRTDINLLNTVPEYRTHDGSCVGIDEEAQIHFILESGDILSNCVRREEDHQSNYAHEGPTYRSGESILEAIARHECANDLKYVVAVHDGYRVENHYSRPNFSITIYKPEKGATWADRIIEAQNKADVEVAAEINF